MVISARAREHAIGPAGRYDAAPSASPLEKNGCFASGNARHGRGMDDFFHGPLDLGHIDQDDVQAGYSGHAEFGDNYSSVQLLTHFHCGKSNDCSRTSQDPAHAPLLARCRAAQARRKNRHAALPAARSGELFPALQAFAAASRRGAYLPRHGLPPAGLHEDEAGSRIAAGLRMLCRNSGGGVCLVPGPLRPSGCGHGQRCTFCEPFCRGIGRDRTKHSGRKTPPA